MTEQEAKCFKALRHWQRAFFTNDFLKMVLSKPTFVRTYEEGSVSSKIKIVILFIVLLPILLFIWIYKIIKYLFIFSFKYLNTFRTPNKLRPPGERNINGIHNQFNPYMTLPPTFYIKCIDSWIAILYGKEKLSEFSLDHYLDTDFLFNQYEYAQTNEEKSLLINQVHEARSELSQELGHYP